MIICYDMTYFRAGHLLRNNIKMMRSFLAYTQEAVPMKIKEINIFNAWPSFNIIKTLIRPFMKAELMDQVSWIYNNN
jgi:hypothetical protein